MLNVKRAGLVGWCCGMVVLAVASAFARADIYQWQFNRGDPLHNAGINDRAGRILGVDATYNDATNRLSWYVDFGGVPPGGPLVTDGYTLALSAGPNPKGHAGELALLYLDGSDADNPILTAYGYNGRNSLSTYYDGSERRGRQRPDRIASSLLDDGWIDDLSIVDHADGTRTIGFTIDATVINDHDPLYGDGDDWFGIGFGERLGLWMHSFAGLRTRYDDGYLNRWCYRRHGWFDGRDQETTLVPVPGASILAVMGLGVVGVIRRRSLGSA